VGLDDGPRDRESEPGAARNLTVALTGGVCPIEAIEDAVEILSFQAGTAILNREFYPLLCIPGRENNPATFWCVTQCVIQNICEDLCHSPRIHFDV